MVWLIFAIGLSNLCLGYAMAVYLGYGPPPLWEGCDAPPTAGAPSDPVVSVDRQTHELPEESVPQTEAPQPPEPEEVPQPPDESAASLFGKWSAVIAKGTSRLRSLDARIRECTGHYDRQTIWRCVVELQEICETYLRQQDKAAGQFSNCFGESDEMGAAGEQLEEAILEQSAQLETTISNLRHMDFESDLPGTSRRLLTEIERMLGAASKLLDGMEAVFPTIPRHDAD